MQLTHVVLNISFVLKLIYENTKSIHDRDNK